MTARPAEAEIPAPYVDPRVRYWRSVEDRPDWHYDLERWLVEVGLCSWDSSPVYRPHPQEFALAVFEFFERRAGRPRTVECLHHMTDRFLAETLGLYEFFETVGPYEAGKCSICGVDDGERGWAGDHLPRAPWR